MRQAISRKDQHYEKAEGCIVQHRTRIEQSKIEIVELEKEIEGVEKHIARVA